jgi:hypothetical protein
MFMKVCFQPHMRRSRSKFVEWKCDMADEHAHLTGFSMFTTYKERRYHHIQTLLSRWQAMHFGT